MVLILTFDNDIDAYTVFNILKNRGQIVNILHTINNQYKYSFEELKQYINDAEAIWMKRGDLKFEPKIHNSFNKEYKSLHEYLIYLAESKEICLGSFKKDWESNKLINLDKAEKCGLLVPVWKIFSRGNEIKDYLHSRSANLLTKAIWNQLSFEAKGKIITLGQPSLINSNEAIEAIEYFPSFIQDYIDKIFDVRIFYLIDRFYSMAIFSQKKDVSKVDFRGNSGILRVMPYVLPRNVEHKLRNFINQNSLNTASIDMVVDRNYNHYFLEINPLGQYGWLAERCNYDINYQIANYLTYGKLEN